MAKAVVWGGMLIVTFTGIFMGLQMITADAGKLVGYAVGKPDANHQCQLQYVVGLMDTAADPPTQTVSPTSTTPDWNHWLSQHYVLKDDAGHVIDLKKGGFKSKDINENQAQTAEFIALATLEAGKTYTLEVTPIAGQPEKYTHTIEGAAKAFRRTNFEPNY